jgi:hypothetical protein
MNKVLLETLKEYNIKYNIIKQVILIYFKNKTN